MSTSQIYGVLVTFKRQAILAETIRKILQQSKLPDLLLVIDNEASSETEEIVKELQSESKKTEIRYLSTEENLGSAGGWAYGMQHILEEANDEDWFLPLDDDDPPKSNTELEKIFQFALEQQQSNPFLAAVGIVGACFSWKTGRIQRIPDNELQREVSVDWLGNGHVPLYSIKAIRDVGVFQKELFFGYTEVEFGLRLRRAGYQLIVSGKMMKERRKNAGKLGWKKNSSRQCDSSWKNYYVSRNRIHIMRQFGRWDLALKEALIQSFLKPAYTFLFSPRSAYAGFLQGIKASWYGFFGPMGRQNHSGQPNDLATQTTKTEVQKEFSCTR